MLSHQFLLDNLHNKFYSDCLPAWLCSFYMLKAIVDIGFYRLLSVSLLYNKTLQLQSKVGMGFTVLPYLDI